MKSKTYRIGKTSCKAYLKDCGNGWEVGFSCGTKTVFVGNFIHSTEASSWFSTMNSEIRSFSKRYTVGPSCPTSWYTHFLSSQLYKKYYTFLNRTFVQHNRKATKEVTRNVKKYQRLNRTTWHGSHKSRILKEAA